MKKLALFLGFILVLMFFASCATPPTEEMNSAHEAVARAENNADAVRYSGNLLVRARDAITRMEIEADAKRYEAAKNLAAEAIVLADRAIDEGMIAAIRARDEAAALIHGLAAPLAETTTALDTAAQDSLDLDVNGLLAELDSARTTYNGARQDLETANYRDAIAGGQEVRSSLSDINSAITEAAQAASRKQ